MNYFLKNRISAYMLFVGLFMIGVISLYKSSVSLMPNTTQPGISVIIEYPGVAPQKIETIITKPVEKIVKTVSGIENMNSVSEEGKSRININFNLDADIKLSALKVREKIALIRPYFPREVQEPVVVRYDPSDKPVVIATVEMKGKTLVELREIVDRKIKPQLQRIDGISEITIAGGLIREIHINVDRSRFEARSQSFKEVAGVIQQNNISLPGGTMFSAGKEYIIYTDSRYKSIAEIADTVIMRFSKDQPGIPITIKDFAEVKSSFREKDDIARLNGKERVTLYIHKAGDANTLHVCQNAIAILKNNSFCETTVIYNQGEYIDAAIDNVINSGIWGILIVILVLSLFMKRVPVVFSISLSIPVTLIIVFACMYFLGINLNVMSLSGLALGAGMIVDNGIVISESIFSRKNVTDESMLSSISQVRNALISSTITTIIVFFPIVFGNAATKKSYGDLSFTVSCALILSLLVSIILIPAIIAEFLHRKTGKPKKSRKSFTDNKLFRNIHDGFILLQNKVTELEQLALGKYKQLLDYAFTNSKRILIITGSLAFIALIMSTLIKSEMVDPMESNEFYVYLEFPTGTSLTQTDKAVKLVEKHIKDMKITEKLSTKVEKWRGTLSVKLRDSITSEKKKKRVKTEIKTAAAKLLKKYNAFPFISEADEIAARELSIMFIGEENAVLRKIATYSAKKIHGIKGIEDCVLRFREGRPEFRLTVDRDKANSLGLYAADITNFLRSGIFGPVITKYIDKDREVDVRIKYSKEYKKTIDDILHYTIKNSEGSLVPLREVITMTEDRAPTKVWRYNGRRCVTITAKIGSLSYSEAAYKISKTLKGVPFPEEYSWEFDENLKKMRENRKSMAISVIIAILLVYMVLASLFESFTVPVVIMTTVPLALIGVIITLFVTGSTMNISVYIGLIVLAGIVVNNGIILINTINREHREGKLTARNLVTKIQTICLSRFRPVMITTITTVLGLFPMLIKTGEGSNLWRPLSLTVISGLLFSTALTLVIVPLFGRFMYAKIVERTQKEV